MVILFLFKYDTMVRGLHMLRIAQLESVRCDFNVPHDSHYIVILSKEVLWLFIFLLLAVVKY